MPTQTFEAFIAGVRRGTVPQAVYLHGSEDVLKEEAVSEIVTRLLDPSVKDFNFDQRSATNLDPEDAETLCFSLPMLAERRVAIIRDVEAWNKRGKAKSTVLRFLDRPSQETALILIQGSASTELDPDLVSRTTSVAADSLSQDDAKAWVLRHMEK